MALWAVMNHQKESFMPQHLLENPWPVAGIIAEYNPFHNGHGYLIQEAKRLSNAPYCVVAMSGDFVQRGEPAVFDKYARTYMALAAGADLVVELPPAFALASAEDFASCGISLLDSLGVVSHVCFGSECGSLSPLMDLARILASEPEPFQASLRQETALGQSYPKARQTALSRYLSSCQKQEDTSALLAFPNNILAVEYLKALIRSHSSMTPVTISRKGAGYHDETLGFGFSSATAIRKIIFDQYREHPPVPGQDAPLSCGGLTEALKDQMPPCCLETAAAAVPLNANDFSLLLSYRLLEHFGDPQELCRFADVSPDLARRISRQTYSFSSFDQRAAALKTRQYTYTRISRCLMHILLNLTREDIDARKRMGYVTSIRILGFRKNASPLLSAVKRGARLPLVTKTADAPRILSPHALSQFQQDLFCSHVYQAAAEQKCGLRPKNEYTRSVIIV